MADITSGVPLMNLPEHWTDLERALFLLDGAEQSLVDEFHTTTDPNATALLTKYAASLNQLRREMAIDKAQWQVLTTDEVAALRALWSDDDRRPGGTIARDTILRLLDVIEWERRISDGDDLT